MTDEFVPLGCVLRLDVLPDSTAGAQEDLLCDRLALSVMRYLSRLSAASNIDELQTAAREVLVRQQQEAEALSSGRPVSTDSVDLSFEVVAVAMLMRAVAPEGYPLYGYRWRLVRRDRVEHKVFSEEVRAAEQRMARWLAAR